MPVDVNTIIDLKVSFVQLNLILNHLGKGEWNIVNDLIIALRAQVQQQLESMRDGQENVKEFRPGA
jgi:hypothetical protein